MNDGRTDGSGTPGAWRLRDHPLVIAGMVVIVLAVIAYWMPGIVFVGSVSQVRSLCSSGAGLFAMAGSQTAESSCTDAESWTAVLAVAAVAGVGMIIAGVFRNRR